MFIGRLAKLIDYIDESEWIAALNKHQFWVDSPEYADEYDANHKALAFFLLMNAGRIGHAAAYNDNGPKFDHTACPSEFLADPAVLSLVAECAKRHAVVYGPGFIAKMGLYTFAPGGQAGYHVDGIVRLAGDHYDVSTQREWDAAVHIQSSHRTVMPLMLGDGAEFLIVGKSIRITPGLWFEFSNTLPHAFFNRSDQHSMLLVTTYKPTPYASF
jgi:hypothetical protein